MIRQDKHIIFFDESYGSNEQLPREFTVSFKEINTVNKPHVEVRLDDVQIGNIVNDNSYENDYYRYHDIFHYTFATMLGWSPCSRSMMKRKRKSNSIIDDIEDGARAAITEEAISLIIFNEAKRKRYFKAANKVNKTTLKFIKQMTDCFEVKTRSEREWEETILKSYELFRLLIKNRGGTVFFDMNKRKLEYIPNN